MELLLHSAIRLYGVVLKHWGNFTCIVLVDFNERCVYIMYKFSMMGYFLKTDKSSASVPCKVEIISNRFVPKTNSTTTFRTL